MSVGGNTKAILQTFAEGQKNAIGERPKSWSDVLTLTGWLDLSGGSSGYTAFAAKVQESTHVFVSDYVSLPASATSENSRMVINGKVYDIMLIDDPMEMHKQLEIYLKYTGGV